MPARPGPAFGGGALFLHPMKIDVILHPAQLRAFAEGAPSRTACVVFDVLRATSSMVTGLEHGVREWFPVSTLEEAMQKREELPGALLGGERHGDRIPGFDLGNSPLEYLERRGARIITTTTNGTVALQACRGAGLVLVGALLNLGAVLEVLLGCAYPEVMLVCAGTGEGLALEDVWAAGALIARLEEASKEASRASGQRVEAGEDCCVWELTDAARTACAVFRQWPDALSALSASQNGRALLAKGRENDLQWCARLDCFQTVGALLSGSVRTWKAGEAL